MSEIEYGKPFPTQLREMITAMISHNPAPSIQLLWALEVMDEEMETGADADTPFNDIHLWERCVLDCLTDNGHLLSPWQFNANMKMIQTIMIEWTKTADDETHGPHMISQHTQNQFTAYVSMQITKETLGINIPKDTPFLFEGTKAPTLHRAFVALFTILQDKCPDIHVLWQEVLHRVNEVHINIPMEAKNKNRPRSR
jgi:hypothetical protein